MDVYSLEILHYLPYADNVLATRFTSKVHLWLRFSKGAQILHHNLKPSQ